MHLQNVAKEVARKNTQCALVSYFWRKLATFSCILVRLASMEVNTLTVIEYLVGQMQHEQ
jgi:hypothetical protein